MKTTIEDVRYAAALAMGMRKRAVSSRYGLTRRQIDVARERALREMVLHM